MDFLKGMSDFFSIGNSISASSNTKPDDVLKTKSALVETGNYNVPDFGITPYPDTPMINGLKSFQQQNGLAVDGVMKPGGPTEAKLGENLANQGINQTDLLEKANVANIDQSIPKSVNGFKEKPKPSVSKIDPLTGLSDPLASKQIKMKMPTAKQWEETAKLQQRKVKTAIIPQGKTTQAAIESLMRDPRYNDKNNPTLREHVQKQFKNAFPGNVKYDETGKMQQPKPIINPEQVEPYDPDGELSAYEWDQENPERIWVEEEKPSKAPARKKAILEDSEADFDIKENPKADGEEPFYEVDQFEEVSKYNDVIDQKAKEVGVEPDELRAIIYMESTHGYYDKPLEWVDKNKSIRPMNVYASYWKDLGYSREDLKDPAKNIEAGAQILKRLKEKMPNASIREISTLYNNLNAEQVNDYGAQVERIYKDKPWRR